MMPKGIFSSSVIAAAEAEVDARAKATVAVCFYLDRGQISNLKSYASKTGMSYSEVFSQIMLFGDEKLGRESRIAEARNAEKVALFGYPDPGVHDAFEDEDRAKRANEILQKNKAMRRDPTVAAAIEKYLRELAEWIQKKTALGGDSGESWMEGQVKYEGEG
jgi:hypothetical protein